MADSKCRGEGDVMRRLECTIELQLEYSRVRIGEGIREVLEKGFNDQEVLREFVKIY